MSSKTKTYRLKKIFGTFLWGRHMAVELRDLILRDNLTEAVVDFSGVIFVTRAFADELLKIKNFFNRKNLYLNFRQMNSEVAKMFSHLTSTVSVNPAPRLRVVRGKFNQ